MDTVTQVTELLAQKKERFREYEEATRSLLDCDIDNMTDYITKRTQLAIEIDKIDAKLRETCDNVPKGDLLSDTIANRCSFGDAPREWQSIFEQGQEVLGCVSRVVELEGRALNRMQELRSGLKKKISENQNTPKIARYLTGLSEQERIDPFMMNKA